MLKRKPEDYMGQEKITMKFADSVFWNQGANQGLGEFQARFVIVHPGREQEAESLMTAFHSAKSVGFKVRDGVVAIGRSNLEGRIGQLSGLGSEHQNTVAELNLGLQAVQRYEETARQTPKAAAATVTAKAVL